MLARGFINFQGDAGYEQEPTNQRVPTARSEWAVPQWAVGTLPGSFHTASAPQIYNSPKAKSLEPPSLDISSTF
jgi:hypothetical protein